MTPEEIRVFRTADFEFLVPDDWRFLESESQPDRVVFESADSRNRLTLSIMYLQRDLIGQQARAILSRVVEHRRTAETRSFSEVRLSHCQITGSDGHCYAKWGGRDAASNRRTGTLVTMENSKLFVLFVESIGTSDEVLNAVADQVFGGFKAK